MIQIFLVFLLAPTALQMVGAADFRHHVIDTKDIIAPEDITKEALGALRQFNLRSVQQALVNQRKSSVVDPLTVATFWALVNEKVFDFETGDIVTALDVPADRITPVFSLINDFLNQDPGYISTNAIFSDLKNSTSSDGLKKLRTYFETVDVKREGDAAVGEINDYVKDHTNGILTDQLLPKSNPFYTSTRGILLSTSSYQRTFARPLTPAGKLTYQVTSEESMSVDSVELRSTLQVQQDEKATVVVIPIKTDANKSIILVHPKDLDNFLANDFEDFTKKIDIISRYDSKKIIFLTNKSVRVQMPVFNLTLARQFRELLSDSVNSTVCETQTTHANFLQNPVQISRVSLTSTGFGVTSVVGAQVENVDEYRKELGAGARPSQNQPGQNYQKPQVRSEGETQIYVHVQHEARSADTEPKLAESSVTAGDNKSEPEQDIVVNSPFILALHDYNVGMHSFLILRRPTDTSNFDEFSKLQRWVCISPPAPPAPAGTN